MIKKKDNYWKQIVILLCLGWIMIWIYRTMLTPIHEQIQETIGTYSNLKIGMISSMYFFSYVITQIPSGLLMDRLGKKVVLIPGFLFFSAGILVIGFASNLNLIFLGSLMAGVGTGTYYSGAFSLSGQYVPVKYKYFATAIINSGCAIGMIVGYLSGGVLVIRAGINWKIIIFAAAALTILVTFAFAVGLKNDEPVNRKKMKQSEKINYSIFFKRKMLATYFMYFSTCYGYYMIVTWLPSFLESERGIEGSTASVYACIVAVVSIPGALFLGKMLDRFSQKRIIMMTCLQIGSAVMLLLITRFTVIVLLMICLAIYGLCGKQAIDPLIVPHVSGGIPDNTRSTGLGIFNFFGMSGSILAPSITGYAEDIMGSKIYGFYIAAILLVISSVFFYFSNNTTMKE